MSFESSKSKVAVIVGATALTLGIHYGWLVEPLFGHVHWIHAVHGRFCYIPIVIAAAWFGLRGGLIAATAISVLLLPFIFGGDGGSHDLAVEIGELVFYFAIATLIGVLVDREFAARRMRDAAQQHLERSQKLSLVGQIAAGVAHEIKNPLASIKGAADILTDESTSQSAREEFREIMRNEVHRIDATVAEFLEFARPKDVELAALDLSDTVRPAVRTMSTQAQQRGVSLVTELAPGVRVNGDAEKLHQMTVNLLLNAIQATSEGGTVTLSVTKSARAALLKISDTGTGIDANLLEHIFDPFYTTRSSGTGLGLAVVRSIVDAHDGAIDVDSKPARGTHMKVTLPRLED